MIFAAALSEPAGQGCSREAVGVFGDPAPRSIVEHTPDRQFTTERAASMSAGS